MAFAACAVTVGLNAWLVLLVICGGFFFMALGVLWSILLTRAVYWLSRSRQLFARGWASPLDLRYLTLGNWQIHCCWWRTAGDVLLLVAYGGAPGVLTLGSGGRSLEFLVWVGPVSSVNLQC